MPKFRITSRQTYRIVRDVEAEDADEALSLFEDDSDVGEHGPGDGDVLAEDLPVITKL